MAESKIEFKTAQALIDHLNDRLGMDGFWVPKENRRGEVCYFSPTDILLFKVEIYHNAFYGWRVGGQGLVQDFNVLLNDRSKDG